MPFTLSHPAAVLPFAQKRGLTLSALVIGSMSPDFSYFLRLHPSGNFGHTLPGLFLFCLPLGFMVLWLFHALLERPLNDILPARLAQPVTAFAWSWGQIGSTIISLLLGAVTHIVWDAFTHESGWGVAHVPFLRWELPLGERTLPLYKVAQHGSTFIGFAAIAYWLYNRQQPTYQTRYSACQKVSVWLVLFGSSSLSALLYSLSRAPLASLTFSSFLGRFVVTSISALLLALVIFALVIRFHKTKT